MAFLDPEIVYQPPLPGERGNRVECVARQRRPMQGPLLIATVVLVPAVVPLALAVSPGWGLACAGALLGALFVTLRGLG